MALQNRQTPTKLLLFIYTFPETNMLCVSLRSLPFFINISRFSGWAVILSKDVGHYLKPINNLLILSFHSLKSLLLTEKKLEMNLYRQKCN